MNNLLIYGIIVEWSGGLSKMFVVRSNDVKQIDLIAEYLKAEGYLD